MSKNRRVRATTLPGVFTVDRPLFQDSRGFFKEIVRAAEIEEMTGYHFVPVQASHAHSKKGALRGIHVAPWAKLVYVMHGRVQQVIVDLRPESANFGKYLSSVMGEEKRIGFFIPPGFGSAHLVLSDTADYIYLVDDYWQEGKEWDLAWNDPDLGISWQVKSPIVSQKDTHAPRLRELFAKKFK